MPSCTKWTAQVADSVRRPDGAAAGNSPSRCSLTLTDRPCHKSVTCYGAIRCALSIPRGSGVNDGASRGPRGR